MSFLTSRLISPPSRAFLLHLFSDNDAPPVSLGSLISHGHGQADRQAFARQLTVGLSCAGQADRLLPDMDASPVCFGSLICHGEGGADLHGRTPCLSSPENPTCDNEPFSVSPLPAPHFFLCLAHLRCSWGVSGDHSAAGASFSAVCTGQGFLSGSQHRSLNMLRYFEELRGCHD